MPAILILIGETTRGHSRSRHDTTRAPYQSVGCIPPALCANCSPRDCLVIHQGFPRARHTLHSNSVYTIRLLVYFEDKSCPKYYAHMVCVSGAGHGHDVKSVMLNSLSEQQHTYVMVLCRFYGSQRTMCADCLVKRPRGGCQFSRLEILSHNCRVNSLRLYFQAACSRGSDRQSISMLFHCHARL